jgi:hypothetical protein
MIAVHSRGECVTPAKPENKGIKPPPHAVAAAGTSKLVCRTLPAAPSFRPRSPPLLSTMARLVLLLAAVLAAAASAFVAPASHRHAGTLRPKSAEGSGAPRGEGVGLEEACW